MKRRQRRPDGTAVSTAIAAARLAEDATPVDVRREQPTPDALALVPEAVARRLRLLPIRFADGTLDIAVADPSDAPTRQFLASLPVAEVRLRPADLADLEHGLNASYRLVSPGDAQVQAFWSKVVPEEQVSVSTTDDAPVIQLVNRIIAQALRDRASDVHIEPTEGRVRIRYRVDGALREVLSLPSQIGPELVSRVKVLAEMDIVERRRPQDGQFQMTIDGVGVDIRVASGATIWGETAVLRLLDKSRSRKELAELGMPADCRDRYLSIIHRPYGMIVCTGPTGSGKTTTLYASLAEISREELNIMTIEDPVEYVFPTVNQMQINLQAEVTFAGGLKSILRQDPDVILVGEIRDQETAAIAVQAALTGHLVMSSLHSTDACAALYRLLDMGIEPFLVASSVVGVVGQRLVRKICPSCAEPHQPSPSDLRFYDFLGGAPKSRFMRGAGCHYCSGTGFRERVGVYEVLEVTEGIGQLLVAGVTPHEVRELALKQGMRTMASEALTLVTDDVTTIDEVVRNVYIA